MNLSPPPDEEPSAAADWAALPEGPLSIIATFLPSICDFAVLRAVCSSWRRLPRNPLLAFPLLLLPHSRYLYSKPDATIDANNTAHLFSLPDHRRLRLPLLDFAHLRLLPLAHGHLLIIGLSPSLSLVNPFTFSSIPLPSLTAFPDDTVSFYPSRMGREYYIRINGETCTLSAHDMQDWFISTAIISADPTGSGCIVMVVFCNNHVAFCRPGDQSWTIVDADLETGTGSATFFHGKFYILDYLGCLTVCDASCWPPNLTMVSSSSWFFNEGMLLVDAAGELLLIIYNHHPNLDAVMTIESWKDHFEVYRMQLTPTELTWVPAKEIGDKALFLGENHSFAITASELPDCRPNCIYYGNKFYNHRKDHDILVFNIKDGSCEKICRYHSGSWDRKWRYASWFLPRLA